MLDKKIGCVQHDCDECKKFEERLNLAIEERNRAQQLYSEWRNTFSKAVAECEQAKSELARTKQVLIQTQANLDLLQKQAVLLLAKLNDFFEKQSKG